MNGNGHVHTRSQLKKRAFFHGVSSLAFLASLFVFWLWVFLGSYAGVFLSSEFFLSAFDRLFCMRPWVYELGLVKALIEGTSMLVRIGDTHIVSSPGNIQHLLDI